MMNSLKSACSFAKSTPVPLYQFQQHLEAVFRRKFSIELIIGLIRIFETTEHLNNAVHGNTLTCGWRSFAHTGFRRGERPARTGNTDESFGTAFRGSAKHLIRPTALICVQPGTVHAEQIWLLSLRRNSPDRQFDVGPSSSPLCLANGSIANLRGQGPRGCTPVARRLPRILLDSNA